MPCIGRRGCAERFRHLPAGLILAVIWHHGTCGACALDCTDHPRFHDDPVTGLPRPYCPACSEEHWPTGGAGPFERGQPQVMLR